MDPAGRAGVSVGGARRPPVDQFTNFSRTLATRGGFNIGLQFAHKSGFSYGLNQCFVATSFRFSVLPYDPST